MKPAPVAPPAVFAPCRTIPTASSVFASSVKWRRSHDVKTTGRGAELFVPLAGRLLWQEVRDGTTRDPAQPEAGHSARQGTGIAPGPSLTEMITVASSSRV